MIEHENVDVRCVSCGAVFVTSQKAFEDIEAACPRCGFQALAMISEKE